MFVSNMTDEMRVKAVRGLRLAAVRGLQTIQTVIIPSRTPQPVDRGIYRAAWKVASIPDGAELYNDSPVGPIIEGGVRAANVKIGKALIDALTAWVIRKRLVKPVISKKQPSMIAAATAMAWAIAKAARQGKGFHNPNPSGGLRIMQELNDRYIRDFVRESVTRELER